MKVGQYIRLINPINTFPQEITEKIGSFGIVRGFKYINYNLITVIVEFSPCCRCWLFYEEIE